MPLSARLLVRRAVGFAALAPGIALGVLSVLLIARGDFAGVFAGFVVGALAIALSLVALLMTNAPVSIARMLRRTDDERERRDAQGRDPQNGGPP